MLSYLELGHILENAFLPTICKCEVDSTEILTLHFINARTHEVILSVGNIHAAELSSSRTIAAFVGELKGRIAQVPQSKPERRRHPR